MWVYRVKNFKIYKKAQKNAKLGMGMHPLHPKNTKKKKRKKSGHTSIPLPQQKDDQQPFRGLISLNTDRVSVILEPTNIYSESPFQKHIKGDNLD